MPPISRQTSIHHPKEKAPSGLNVPPEEFHFNELEDDEDFDEPRTSSPRARSTKPALQDSQTTDVFSALSVEDTPQATFQPASRPSSDRSVTSIIASASQTQGQADSVSFTSTQPLTTPSARTTLVIANSFSRSPKSTAPSTISQTLEPSIEPTSLKVVDAPTNVVSSLPGTALPPTSTHEPIPGPHFSPFGIFLIAGGVFTAILLSILALRYTMRRNKRAKSMRARKRYIINTHWGSGSDDSGSNEKNNTDSSPVFGGRERTGLTPLPSAHNGWSPHPDITEKSIGRATASATPYLSRFQPNSSSNLIPSKPPILPQPSYDTNDLHQTQFTVSTSNGSLADVGHIHAVIKTASRGSFMPPTITVTGSSPNPNADHRRRLLEKYPQESSSVETEFKLVKPPKLTLVNNETARDSGSSWDNTFGVEFGAKLQKTSKLIVKAQDGSPLRRGFPASTRRSPTNSLPRTSPRSATRTPLLYNLPGLPEKSSATANSVATGVTQPLEPFGKEERRPNNALTTALGLETPPVSKDRNPLLFSASSTSQERLFGGIKLGGGTPTRNDEWKDSTLSANTKFFVSTNDIQRTQSDPTNSRSSVSIINSPATFVGRMMLSTYDDSATEEENWVKENPVSPVMPSRALGGAYVNAKRVPSLPTTGPSLRQLALIKEMPDYRSPTYSIYGMYSGGDGETPTTKSSVKM